MGLFSNLGGSGSSTVCPSIPDPEYDSDPVSGGRTVSQWFNILSTAFMAGAVLSSMVLYFLHATHFSNPGEQTKIMRIIFFIPVLSLVSFGSVQLGENALYLLPWSFLYEGFALANFFMLVCTYISPQAYHQEQFFDTVQLKGGKIAGAKWFRHTRRMVFQYTPIALIVAVASDASVAAGTYCATSNSFHFAHLWLTIIKAVSVTFAAMSAITFTMRLKSALANKKIFQKLIAFKVIIFLETIQNLVFSFIRGNVTPTTTFSYVDLTVGLPSLLLCIECFLVSIFLHFTYCWQPYRSNSTPTRYQGGFLGLKAIISTLNPAEAFREFAYAFGLAHPNTGYSHYNVVEETVPLGAYDPARPNPAFGPPRDYAYNA